MQRPVIVGVIAFCGGIVVADKLPGVSMIIVLLIAGLLLSGLLVTGYRRRGLVLLCVLLFCGGVFNVWIRQIQLPPMSNLPLTGIFSGTIASEPEISNGKTSFLLDLVQSSAKDANYNGQKAVVFIRGSNSHVGLHYGQRVRLRGDLTEPRSATNPGQFDYRQYLANQAIYLILNVKQQNAVMVTGQSDGWLIKHAAIQSSLRIARIFAQLLPPQEAALMQGMILGARTELSDDIVADFQRAGVYHLLAVSGFNIAIVIGICFAVLGVIGVSPKRKASLTIGAVFFYTVITGAQPSAVRAGIMGIIYLLAILFGRSSDILTSLSLAALLMLLYNPGNLFDVGFQLSFTATLGIVLLTATFTKFLKRLPKWLCTGLAVTIAAYLATLPVIIFHFSRVSLIGLLANLIIVPMATVVMWFGVILIVTGLISISLASLFAPFCFYMLKIMLGITALFANLPLAQTVLPPPGIVTISLFYILLIAFFSPLNQRIKPYWQKIPKATAAAVLILVVLVLIGFYRSMDQPLQVTFLDVGEGDAILIRTPNKQNILIDGGPAYQQGQFRYDAGATVVLPYLMHLGIKHLDLMIFTHPHQDHLGGLTTVVENLKVDGLGSAYPINDKAVEVGFASAVRQHHVPTASLHAGQQLSLGDGASIEILSPDDELFTGTRSDENNNSVVIRLQYGRIAFLLSGDIDEAAETQLLASDFPLTGTVLKIAHHGSNYASSAQFIEAVNPRIAVISVGKNNYGHPSFDVIRRLKEQDITVLRTDQSGAITFTTNGKSLKCSTFCRNKP